MSISSKIVMVVFLVCGIGACNTKKSIPNLEGYIQNTIEIENFCKEMISCIREEISRTFRDLPQQKHYLLSKTSISTCQREQAVRLNRNLKFSPLQIEELYQEYEIFQKTWKNSLKQRKNILDSHQNAIFSFPLSIRSLEYFATNQQKQMLKNFHLCFLSIQNVHLCKEKRKVLKNNSYCKKIFSS